MGQAITKHEMLISGLRHVFKAQGVKVKIKQSCELFDYIKDVCPWFSTDETTDEKKMKESWRGSQRSLSSIWTRKIPVTAFSFWNLIDKLLSQRYQDSAVANAIETGEEILLKIS